MEWKLGNAVRAPGERQPDDGPIPVLGRRACALEPCGAGLWLSSQLHSVYHSWSTNGSSWSGPYALWHACDPEPTCNRARGGPLRKHFVGFSLCGGGVKRCGKWAYRGRSLEARACEPGLLDRKSVVDRKEGDRGG